MYKTPARRLFPALCALLLAFAACKNPIISEWYREDDKESQNQSSTAASQTSQSAVLQRVNDLALTYNVPAPYGSETPVRSFAGPQYEGRVDWSVSGGGAHNGPFVTGTSYTALVNIVAAAGWTFDGVAENSFAHLGGAGAAVRNAAGAGTALLVIIDFAPAENALPVDDLNLTFYVPAPETGGIPALSLAGPQYTAVVSWSSAGGPHNGVFWPGTAYTATVTMQTASGRTFSGVGPNAFRHWAAAAGVSNNADSGVVSIVFPATGPGEPVSSPIDLTAYIRRPVLGGERTGNFRTAAYYGTVEWETGGAPMPDGFFQMDKVYTAKVTLFPVLGYVFPVGVTVTHTKADTVTMEAANPVQAAVSIVFPKTGKIVPLASGGNVTFRMVVPGYYYEVHTFTADGASPGGQALSEYKILDGTHPPAIEVLVVAGGGGGGGSVGPYNTASGGGAGRFVYHPAFKVGTGELWTTPGTITVKVGAGGSGGGIGASGANGGDSAFVRYSGYQIIAKGGGAGAGNPGVAWRGQNGGSGGGSHSGVPSSNWTLALAGTVPAESGVLNLGSGGHYFTGGGAGDDGASANWGKGVQSAISGEPRWYAGGGHTGANWEIGGAGKGEAAEKGTGDGGGGGNGPNLGTSGASGIVIVRFLHPGDGL